MWVCVNIAGLCYCCVSPRVTLNHYYTNVNEFTPALYIWIAHEQSYTQYDKCLNKYHHRIVCTIYTELYAPIKTSIISSDDVEITLPAFRICLYIVEIAITARQTIHNSWPLSHIKIKIRKATNHQLFLSCADFLSQ